MRYLTLLTLCVLPLVAAIPVQDPERPQQADRRAYDDDVMTIETTIAALYDVISGDADHARDWDRFRNLFTPGARLIPVQITPDDEVASNAWSPEAYIVRAQSAFEHRGFHEKEIARRSEQFGNIAHVWSTYETREHADDAAPEARGINSIQLMHDGARWWIVTIFWQAEDENHPLPEKYLAG